MDSKSREVDGEEKPNIFGVKLKQIPKKIEENSSPKEVTEQIVHNIEDGGEITTT